MLDMKFVRENPDKVMQAVANRNGHLDLTEFLELDKKRRELTQQVEALKKERNTCLLYTSPSPRDETSSRMPSSA